MQNYLVLQSLSILSYTYFECVLVSEKYNDLTELLSK